MIHSFLRHGVCNADASCPVSGNYYSRGQSLLWWKEHKPVVSPCCLWIVIVFSSCVRAALQWRCEVAKGATFPAIFKCVSRWQGTRCWCCCGCCCSCCCCCWWRWWWWWCWGGGGGGVTAMLHVVDFSCSFRNDSATCACRCSTVRA